jgi:glycosyltransferase involved in cell wall biosynthesis
VVERVEDTASQSRQNLMGNLRVGIDVSPLELTGAGTARYLQKLIAVLEREPGIELHRHRFPGSSRPAKIARDTAWYLGALPVASRGDDVLHLPAHRGPLLSAAPLVVTIHDLAVIRHPEAFNRWTRRYSRALLPRLARAARRVIAVSEFTAREAVELLGVDEQRLRVIPHGVEEPFTPHGAAAEGGYVLAVGTLEPRKNLPRVVLAAERAGIDVRVVGGSGWGDVDVESAGFVPDDELARLYRGAAALVYPSLYEGFGLPVLEAMACGTPVVTSEGSAPAAVADGAAVLVDPLDVEAIAEGIRDALRRREELRVAGLERAKEFTWESAAKATAEVYREAAA